MNIDSHEKKFVVFGRKIAATKQKIGWFRHRPLPNFRQ